jgi:L-threonylcarbamoyladenylate synthase
MIVPATEEALHRAGEILRRGGLVGFPTETVYGLGANALDPDAVARIFEVKKRPLASPVIVHVTDSDMARTLTAEWSAEADKLARHFWPGPLTVVIRKAALVPDVVTAGLDSVGIRVPGHPVALALIRAARVPIAAPSANVFTELSPTTAEHVEAGLGREIEMILDGGPAQVGIESTVVSLRRVPPAVLRPGVISRGELEHVTGVTWEQEMDRPHPVDEPMESPGQHPRHYAPRTPLYVLEDAMVTPKGRGRLITMPSDRDAYARVLYTELHRADEEGWDWIALLKPPETPDWAGVHDRLRRASARP